MILKIHMNAIYSCFVYNLLHFIIFTCFVLRSDLNIQIYCVYYIFALNLRQKKKLVKS